MAHRYIGRNIYELRKKRGWSQSDLARKLDKKASTISSYETDSKTPSVDTIIAMSELFGVSIDELIYGENAEVLSTKHLAAEQKRAVADLLQGLTLYNDGNDKDGLARTRLRAALLFWAKLVFCYMKVEIWQIWAYFCIIAERK